MRADATFKAWATNNPVFLVDEISGTSYAFLLDISGNAHVAGPANIKTFYDKCTAGYICLEGSKTATPTDP